MRFSDMNWQDIAVRTFIYTSMVTFPVLVGMGIWKLKEMMFR